MVLDWSVRLRNGRLVRKRTQGTGVAQVRRHAKAKARELLETRMGEWKQTSSMSKYIEEVCIPSVVLRLHRGSGAGTSRGRPAGLAQLAPAEVTRALVSARVGKGLAEREAAPLIAGATGLAAAGAVRAEVEPSAGRTALQDLGR